MKGKGLDSKDWLTTNFFHEVPREFFFGEIQGTECAQAVVSSEGRQRLPGWDEINRFLSEHRLSHPRVRMALEGAETEDLTILNPRRTLRGEPVFDILPDRVYANLRNGGTLVLDAVDLALPSVKEISLSVTRHFHVRSQTNAYITFGESRGFGLHWDDHDVFIVQIEGRKRWDIYGTTRTAPMHKDFHEVHPEPTEVERSLVLSPGSILYVPRGCWHDVVGMGEPTFHLTIGVTPCTGVDLLHWLEERAREVEFLRKDLPLHQPEKLAEYSRQFLSEMLGLAGDSVAEEFLKETKRTTQPYPRFSLPFGTGYAADGSKQSLHLVPATYNVEQGPSFLVLEANNRRWRLPSGIAPLIEALEGSTRISIDQSWDIVRDAFPGYVGNDWRDFIDDLIAQGLFYCGES